MKIGKKRNEQSSEPSENPGKNTNKPDRIGLLQILCVAAGFVIAGLALDLTQVAPLERSAAKVAIETRLDAQKRQLEQRINNLSSLVRSFAREPSIVETIDSDEARTQAAEFFANMVPQVQGVYLFPYGEIDQSATPALSFASIDLARSAASRGAVMMDAFRRDGQWLFQIAAPVVVDGSERVRGSALVVLGEAALRSALVQPTDLPGTLSLVQRVGASEAVILSQGITSGDQVLTRELSIPGWSLQLKAPLGGTPLLGRLQFWSVIAGIGILTAALVFLLMQGLVRALKKDVLQLNQWAQKAFAGERAKLQQLSIGTLAALGETLQRLAQTVDKRVLKAEVAAQEAAQAARANSNKNASRHSEHTDAPLFQDRDFLDIDVLDGDEDILGLGTNTSVAGLSSVPGAELEEAMTVEVEIPGSIFRAYDIRGIVGETLTPEIVRYIGLAIGSEAISRGSRSICVGYDGRHSSPELADALARGLTETGCEVIEVGRVPTPVLYFATHHLQTGSGVMITGSHNPSNYNGLKMMIGGQTLAGDDIQKLLTRIQTSNFAQGQGSRRQQDVQQAYLDRILADVAVAAPLKVVVDAGNGIAGELGPRLIEELGCDVIPLYCDVDGDFPNHHPDPGKPENLNDLIERVKSENADLGIAFDGDGDRVGVVTNSGKIIWADRLLMLFARDVVSRNPGADIIYDVKCSRRLATTINEFGGRPIMWKTGHSWMKAKMKETGALLAGEMSGHIFFAERWLGFDDGIYSAARLLEILGVEDRTSDEVFADFPEDVSTPEINLAVTDENKFGIIEELAGKGEFGEANINTIDGVRVDYPDGWGLCRASNTTPALVLRFEAEDEESLERIKAVFRSQMQKIAPEVELTF